MNYKKYIACFLLLISKFVFGGVMDWRMESDIPLTQCNLETVVSFHIFKDSSTQAAYGKESIKLNEQIIKLANKAKNPNLSVGEQLSVEDRIAFDINRERRITISLQQLIESNKLRDIQFLSAMTQVAYHNYRFTDVFDKNDSRYVPQNYIYLLRAMNEKFPYKEWTSASDRSSKCSFNLAIEAFQKEAITKINTLDSEALLIKLQTLAKKYNMQSIDFSKFSKSDKEYFDKLQATEINPLNKATNLADDIENIKLMSNASDLIYKSLQDDLNYSGGNSNNYGQNLKKIMASKETSERMKYALNIWEVISTDNPSEQAKRQKEAADYATKVGKESVEKIKKYKDSKPH
jgi:hypothetical protein